MMTDRGVSFDYVNSAGKVYGKVFPLPNFTPAIIHAKLAQGKIEVIRAIPIVAVSYTHLIGHVVRKKYREQY